VISKNGHGQPQRVWHTSAWKWLVPGLNVKRWLVLLLLGVTLVALSVAYMLVTLYRELTVPPIFYYLTLQFTPRLVRAAIVGVLGIVAVSVALVRLNRSLLEPFVRPDEPLVDTVYRHRRRERGPKVVAIGGGTGLSTLLRGLKQYTSNISAIVTVADDGGSSGRLRRELGVLPPGDFRNCIAALAQSESLTTQLFQYRFAKGQGLDGHSFGNLFIAAMAAVTGSFESALVESSRVLAVQGRILPSTLQNVTLMADLREEEDGRLNRVTGESSITKTGGTIERVYLEPGDVRPYPEAIRAILDADMIVLGPGSLYTSIMPNLLVRDIVRAIRSNQALKLYVCNVATQHGETDGYSAADHVAAIQRCVGKGIMNVVLANDRQDVDLRAAGMPEGVGELVQPGEVQGARLVLADLIDVEHPWRHDSVKLARSVIDVYQSGARAGTD
jgi:uncharacterized cofD-like protein